MQILAKDVRIGEKCSRVNWPRIVFTRIDIQSWSIKDNGGTQEYIYGVCGNTLCGIPMNAYVNVERPTVKFGDLPENALFKENNLLYKKVASPKGEYFALSEQGYSFTIHPNTEVEPV